MSESFRWCHIKIHIRVSVHETVCLFSRSFCPLEQLDQLGHKNGCQVLATSYETFYPFEYLSFFSMPCDKTLLIPSLLPIFSVPYRTLSFTSLPPSSPLSFQRCPWPSPPLGEMIVIEVMEHRWNRIRYAYWEWGTTSPNTIWDFYLSLRLSGSAAYIYIWEAPLTSDHLLYLKGIPGNVTFTSFPFTLLEYVCVSLIFIHL